METETETETETIKVLLVEDNPGDVRLIEEMFAITYNRFELVNADCLADALELVTHDDIKVILLDLGLPDSQGIDTFSKMYNSATDVPIVVLTGFNDETLGMNAVQDGAQDYIVKGEVDGGGLVRAINYAIERQKLITKLKEANIKINTLQGLLPICAACKKIRDDSGCWTGIEKYIRDRSEADFTHSMCPQCAKEYYPEIYGDKK